jgi:hypothetical protein
VRRIKTDWLFADPVIISGSIRFFWRPVIRRNVQLHNFGGLRFLRSIIGVPIFNVNKCGGNSVWLSELKKLIWIIFCLFLLLHHVLYNNDNITQLRFVIIFYIMKCIDFLIWTSNRILSFQTSTMIEYNTLFIYTFFTWQDWFT